MTKKAVILLSGGVDSSTSATIAKAEGYELYALSFDYAQRHKTELESARAVAKSLGAQKHLIMKFDMREIGGSALTSDMEVPKDRNAASVESQALTDKDKESLDAARPTLDAPRSSIPVTYVPARNTIFLSFALSWAEVLEAPDIFIGANAVDYSGYPDCRPGYLKAFEEMANLSTKISDEGKIRFRINAPLLHLTKAEIIRKGTALGLDYALTWSCYDPQNSNKSQVTSNKLNSQEDSVNSSLVPCGRCDSCLIRARGFEEAGLADPLLSRS